MDATTQFATAAVLGTIAHQSGKKRVPGWDLELMALMSGRKIGEAPKGEASSVAIMKAWLASWDAANVAAMMGRA